MKKLKLFQKTYLFTMILIGIIILVSHMLLYVFLPTFYENKKQEDLKALSIKCIQKLETLNKEDCINEVRNFAINNKVDIKLSLGEEVYNFKGNNEANIYVDPDIAKDDQIFIPYFEDYSTSENTVDSSILDVDEKFLKINGSGIIENKNFTTHDNISGSINIIMDLQSFNESRIVIFSILPYSLVISIVISLVASYIYVKLLTNPIKNICKVTKEMHNLKEDAYCKVTTSDEIGVLAEDINSLYRYLWDTIDSLKQEINNVSKAEHEKVEFLRSASHELKTPLMSMHIMLENMILNVGKYKNHPVYLEKCKDTVNDLSNMVQEILDTSRLNKYKDIEYVEIDSKEFIENILSKYSIIIKSKHINLSLDLSDELILISDEKLLTKAISNIISNAVNYTDDGGYINIYFNNKTLVIENECTPIEEEHLKHIFEAFYRADFHRNKNSGGNGLGLYIVKQILTILNMPHSFESINNGMRFTVDLRNNLNQ